MAETCRGKIFTSVKPITLDGLLLLIYIVTDLMNALPGNSSVNTVQHATIDEAVSSMTSAPRPVLVTD
jgi:hypothetical protein